MPEIIPAKPESRGEPATVPAAPLGAIQEEIAQAGQVKTTQAVEPSPPRVRTAPALSTDKAPVGGLKPGSLPYRLAESELSHVPASNQNRRSLELVLWALAAVLLVGAAIAVIWTLFPNILPNAGGVAQTQPTATTVAVVPPTAAASPTTTLLPTDAPTVPVQPTSAPLIIPTPPADGTQFSSLPVANLSGWYDTGEKVPHYADVNLHAGTFQGKELGSIVQFNLRNFPQDSKILFAALELTGRDASRLSGGGEWQIELVENSPTTNWNDATPEQITQAKSLGTIGATLTASDLGPGRLNRLILSETERQLLEQQFQNGNVVLRLRGPVGQSDNLFTWESGIGGSAISAPTLHLVVVPGKFVIVTNTPEPRNVLTAAAYVVRGTDQAKRVGTPTSFPPGVATATPGGDTIIVPAETAVPGNVQTAVARTQIAKAIAATTGTYTPTPVGLVIEFPTNTPVVIPPESLSTATPIPPDADLSLIPIPYDKCQCRGMIIALTDRYGGNGKTPIILDDVGNVVGTLSQDLYYRVARAKEPYSPDHTQQIEYPKDQNGVQQIAIKNLATGELRFITNFSKGIQYDASWAPDGSAIAFVSTAIANTDQIYVYDFATGKAEQISDFSVEAQPLAKSPTWSPDSRQIAFYYTETGLKQIWVMNRDGSNLHNISNNSFNEIDPVWVK
jgi:hypothetical protein